MKLNAAIKTDQSLLKYQTAMGVATHATLGIEQLISHMHNTNGDTFNSLKGSDTVGIPVSKVHVLLNKIHEILDKAVSK